MYVKLNQKDIAWIKYMQRRLQKLSFKRGPSDNEIHQEINGNKLLEKVTFQRKMFKDFPTQQKQIS